MCPPLLLDDALLNFVVTEVVDLLFSVVAFKIHFTRKCSNALSVRWIFNDSVSKNFLLILTVKKVCCSIKFWWKTKAYEKCAKLFGLPCIISSLMVIGIEYGHVKAATAGASSKLSVTHCFVSSRFRLSVRFDFAFLTAFVNLYSMLSVYKQFVLLFCINLSKSLTCNIHYVSDHTLLRSHGYKRGKLVV